MVFALWIEWWIFYGYIGVCLWYMVEVHVGYMVEISSWWVGTYMRCIVDDVGTSWWLIVDVQLMHGTCWFMLLVQVLWCRLIGTGCYRLLVHVDSGSGWFSDSDMLSTFGIYILGRLDGARTCGCSHLPFVVREHRGLYPPSDCSHRIGELELPSGCILRN